MKQILIILLLLLTGVQASRACFQKLYDSQIEKEDKKSSDDKKQKAEDQVMQLQSPHVFPLALLSACCKLLHIRLFSAPVIDHISPPPDAFDLVLC